MLTSESISMLSEIFEAVGELSRDHVWIILKSFKSLELSFWDKNLLCDTISG